MIAASDLGREPAYPTSDLGAWDGLTKRELFAAMALQGLLSDPKLGGDPANYAVGAVRVADALLAELTKEAPDEA